MVEVGELREVGVMVEAGELREVEVMFEVGDLRGSEVMLATSAVAEAAVEFWHWANGREVRKISRRKGRRGVMAPIAVISVMTWACV